MSVEETKVGWAEDWEGCRISRQEHDSNTPGSSGPPLTDRDLDHLLMFGETTGPPPGLLPNTPRIIRVYALDRCQRRGCHWTVSYCRRVHDKRVAEPEPDRDMIWCSLCVYNIEPVAGLDTGYACR